MELGDSAVEPGSVVAGYRVERLLGHGGFAEVYLAIRERDGLRCALKLVLGKEASWLDRLRREEAALDALDHPNVVALIDMVVADGTPALAMEWIDGPTLADLLVIHRPERDAAIDLFIGIVRGVQYAHGRGLIHRDLKPSNVLLASKDGALVPKVADFGLAKKPGSHSAVTASGSELGTPEWSAPEQTRDAASADHRADMYALGAILYALLCGRGPFHDMNHYDTLVAKRRSHYPRPTELVPDLSVDLERLIDELLVPRPQNRLSSCHLLLSRLEGLGYTGPPLPKAPPALSQNRALAALFALPVGALLLGAAFFWWGS